MYSQKMKIGAKRLLILTVALVMVLTTVSCGGGGDSKVKPTSDIEIANFDYGFIEEKNYDERDTTMADTVRSTQLQVDEVYYCLIEFDVLARERNDGTSLMNVLVKFDNLGVADGTTEEAGTGNATEIKFTDAGTGNDSKIATLAYKIPPNPDAAKKLRILIRMLPVSIGESHISVSFEPTTYGEFDIVGADGFTKNLEVVRTQLEAPNITLNRDNLQLRWTHVEHADYYTIFFADQTINTTAGIDQYTPAGAELSFNLSEFASYGVEFGDVKIQACSNSTNFMKSVYSNIETDVQIS